MKKTAKQRPVAAEKPRDNTPLLFLLLILIPVYGGYYNFAALLAGAVLVPLTAYAAHRAGALTLPTGPEGWALYALAAAMLLSAPFAVSPGMAFTGFLRTVVWVLFFVYAATYSPAERASILDAAAYEGAILSGVTIAGFLYGAATGVQDANGRIDGPFQYANAWSLYLLMSLLLLAGKKERRKWDWPAMALLLAGVFLSGSRGTYLLLFGFALAGGVWTAVRQKRWKPVAVGAAALAVIGGLSVLLSGGMVLSRLQAITLSSSSLNGRALYDLDGLRMILDHPMGVGRGGYLYLQPLYQTGVYTLRYIHNEYLQAALDGGVLSGVLTAVLMGALVFRKGAEPRERAVVLAAAAHAFIDFDFQYTAVVFLVLLCGSGGKARTVALPPKWAGRVAAGALTLALGYFSVPYFLSYAGSAEGAYALFPADLSLAEERLQSYSGVEEAQDMAQRILDGTDLSMVAWDCKYAGALQRTDYPAMVRCKYQYLLLNPYRGEVYEDFAAVAERAAEMDPGGLEDYRALAAAAAERLEAVRDGTSPLAWRIVDKPDFDFCDGVLARLRGL